MEERWDVVVIGAGPSGALAAHELARRGQRVLLVEKRRFPRWKVCGACLNGQALAALQGAGLEDLVEGQNAVPLQELRVGYGGRQSSFPLPQGCALSRARFDQALVEAAVAAGAVFRGATGGRVGAATDHGRLVHLSEGGRVSGLESSVVAKVVLVAAGLANRCLDQEASIQTRIDPNARVGAGCVVREAPGRYRPGTIFMAVGSHGYVGLVRLEDGSLNGAAAFDPAWRTASGGCGPAATRLLDEAGFAAIPALESATWQATPPLTRTTSPLAGHRWLVLGDAAGYVEPFTGEGMGWALAAALAAAPLVLAGLKGWDASIERQWDRRHRQLIGRRQRFCRAMASVLRHPHAALALQLGVTRLPWLAAGMVEHLNRPPLPYPAH